MLVSEKRKFPFNIGCITFCLLILPFPTNATFTYKIINSTEYNGSYKFKIDSCPGYPVRGSFNSRIIDSSTISSTLSYFIYEPSFQIVTCNVQRVVAIDVVLAADRERFSCILELPPGDNFNFTITTSRYGCRIALS